ncbi:SLAP domain-containing protein [Bombilactobacillus mellis]|uniref:SLAP domain-containing protein n=1 Tax=Bombilactobacillus mellis TaxID=1218508 RepID=UPI0022470E68|nr:SLAP domain-containing protein [Bombilactobacillus mellis]MCX0279157.1 SLAP domain-containing protein [Bombilactobacillus mellis]
MKKFSVQKTSLVLAALLAVAPMAATVTPAVAAENDILSTVPSAASGSVDPNEEQDNKAILQSVQKLKPGFISQQSIDNNSSLSFIAYMASNIKPVSSEKPAGIFDPEVPGSFAKKDAKVNDYFINSLFQKSSLPDFSEEDQGNLANIKFSLTVYTESSDGKTNVELNDSTKPTADSAGKFVQSVLDMKNDPGSSLNLEYQFYDQNGKSLGDEAKITSKYVYQAPVFTKAVSANVSSTTTPAQTGYSLSLYRNNLADDVRLYDAAGHEITSKVTGALSLASDIKDSKGQTVTDSIFTQPGEYQQQATINFKSILGKDNYEAALQKGGITVFVDGSTKPLKLNANTTGFDAANGVYTYTRKINVTGDPINKPQENKKPVISDVAVNGIVTVKDGAASSVAQLYDPNGNVIVDRALPARTSWITGQKRTINGVDYYQVSTEEYVKASQVYYKVKTEKSITVNVITGNIEYTKIPANVFRVTAGGFTSLWRVSDDGTSMIVKPDRFVPYHSDWKTAQIAVVDGQTFYQVSTNEWIRSENGNLLN